MSADTISYKPNEAHKKVDLIEDPITYALANPIGSLPLMELAQYRKNAVILISDRSRLCPSYLFVHRLIDQLNTSGIPDYEIKIIVALGMHRKQTKNELIELVGEPVFQRVEVLNHSAQPEDCIHLGTTSQGTPIEINRYVVQADLLIATGNIEPHRLVGMSGGIKALIPGTASSNCIEHNHALSNLYKTTIGNIDNPIHQDLAEALRFVSIDYLFNVIVDHQRKIIDAVSGDVVMAHQQGLKLAKKHFIVPVSRYYDLIIASTGGHPKDTQLYQAVKTLQNAADITKPGGTIILAAKCEELFGNGIFQYWVETIQDPSEIIKRLKEKFVLGAHKVEHIHQVTSKYKVYMYTNIPAPLVELLGFIPVTDLQLSIDELTAPFDQIAILPYGGLTFPYVGV